MYLSQLPVSSILFLVCLWHPSDIIMVAMTAAALIDWARVGSGWGWRGPGLAAVCLVLCGCETGLKKGALQQSLGLVPLLSCLLGCFHSSPSCADECEDSILAFQGWWRMNGVCTKCIMFFRVKWEVSYFAYKILNRFFWLIWEIPCVKLLVCLSRLFFARVFAHLFSAAQKSSTLSSFPVQTSEVRSGNSTVAHILWHRRLQYPEDLEVQGFVFHMRKLCWDGTGVGTRNQAHGHLVLTSVEWKMLAFYHEVIIEYCWVTSEPVSWLCFHSEAVGV